ncbi:MAG TPA: M48 family metallopeptidase [Longimicrobiaceae bacterium]|nr:M48 family metallopeptidase [Longimicrobiaceae bacterium]
MYISLRRLRQSTAIAAVAVSTAAVGGCASSISTQQEMQLGAQYSAEINQQLPIVQDPTVHRYINQLGSSISSLVDPRGIPYTFYVVNSDVVNAFAVPGGYIYINRGLIERAENVSELAGVMAHEIGHVVERHSVEQMAKMQQAQVGIALGTILLGQPSQAAALGVNVLGSAIFAGFSRDAEREADMAAVQYLVTAGIDPRGMVTFFNELLAERERSPGAVEQWFSTHPLTTERIQNVQAAIDRLPPGTLANMTTDTPAFQQFKRRVRGLPGPP